MSTDKSDPSKKDATISSADDLTKTRKKSVLELSEEELKHVSGGGRRSYEYDHAYGFDIYGKALTK